MCRDVSRHRADIWGEFGELRFNVVMGTNSDVVAVRFKCTDDLSDSRRLIRQVGVGFPCRGKDRKSTRLNSSHVSISYAVFCLKKKKTPARIALCLSDVARVDVRTRLSRE